jgi:hypothetical protein
MQPPSVQQLPNDRKKRHYRVSVLQQAHPVIIERTVPVMQTCSWAAARADAELLRIHLRLAKHHATHGTLPLNAPAMFDCCLCTPAHTHLGGPTLLGLV